MGFRQGIWYNNCAVRSPVRYKSDRPAARGLYPICGLWRKCRLRRRFLPCARGIMCRSQTAARLSRHTGKGQMDMDGHKLNKKELVPIIALLVFIAVVLILCAISAGRGAGNGEDAAAVQEESERIAKEKAEADQAVDDWLKDYYASQAQGGSSGSGGYTSTGNFTWPVPGFTRLTTQFQEWTYGGYHRGIDIASTGGRSIYGAPIVAADSGKVIKAGWNNSYGNCVYIDHGGGYVTRYAHASSLAVSQGQTVTKGQTIAYVGNTGDSFGAHLHFEVILNGTLQNPMNYFS